MIVDALTTGVTAAPPASAVDTDSPGAGATVVRSRLAPVGAKLTPSEFACCAQRPAACRVRVVTIGCQAPAGLRKLTGAAANRRVNDPSAFWYRSVVAVDFDATSLLRGQPSTNHAAWRDHRPVQATEEIKF